MAVTIKDVAALAGVSPSTVSRTCKNNPSISEETKDRIFKQAISLHRIHVRSASFSLLLPKKSTRTPSIWKRSRESAITVTAGSI